MIDWSVSYQNMSLVSDILVCRPAWFLALLTDSIAAEACISFQGEPALPIIQQTVRYYVSYWTSLQFITLKRALTFVGRTSVKQLTFLIEPLPYNGFTFCYYRRLLYLNSNQSTIGSIGLIMTASQIFVNKNIQIQLSLFFFCRK